MTVDLSLEWLAFLQGYEVSHVAVDAEDPLPEFKTFIVPVDSWSIHTTLRFSQNSLDTFSDVVY